MSDMDDEAFRNLHAISTEEGTRHVADMANIDLNEQIAKGK